jgi:uncharacterized protein YjbI with pentapeptide repeats
LSYIDLNYINLSHANLRGVNLIHANLRHANLSHADLSSVGVEKAQFGFNSGLTQEMKLDLKRRGAIFLSFSNI